MDKYLLHLLKEIKTIIIPGLGALTLTNEEKGEILFMPYLKFDDGKLATHIAEREGMSVQDATNLIAKYVREIEATLNRGESYDMYQFGRFIKLADGQISFQNWDEKVLQEEVVITPAPKEITPEIVSTTDQITEATVSVQKTYEATASYSEEDQWNDDLDLPPINHTVERPKQPILEKTKHDRPKKRFGMVAGLSLLLLLIGGTLFIALFYNTTERTVKQVTAKTEEKTTQKEQSPVDPEIPEESRVESETPSSQNEIEAAISEEPVLEENVKETVHTDPSKVLNKYHIIMGAFREQNNAEKYVTTLNEQGASATIVTQMEGLYLVSYGSYSSPEERASHVSDARGMNPKAWLMIFP